MKQETKSSMIPSILNDSKKQEQTSLEKGTNIFCKEMKRTDDEILSFKLGCKIALADQNRRILNNVIRLISEADLKEFDKV